MGTYKCFEELPVWKSSTELATIIYKNTSCGSLNKDFGLKDQIQRSAVSISNNIAEGFERGSKQEFIHFLYIAKGSCGELRSLLYIAKQINYIDNKIFNEICEITRTVSKQICGLIDYLKNTNISGLKYKLNRIKSKV